MRHLDACDVLCSINGPFVSSSMCAKLQGATSLCDAEQVNKQPLRFFCSCWLGSIKNHEANGLKKVAEEMQGLTSPKSLTLIQQLSQQQAECFTSFVLCQASEAVTKDRRVFKR